MKNEKGKQMSICPLVLERVEIEREERRAGPLRALLKHLYCSRLQTEHLTVTIILAVSAMVGQGVERQDGLLYLHRHAYNLVGMVRRHKGNFLVAGCCSEWRVSRWVSRRVSRRVIKGEWRVSG